MYNSSPINKPNEPVLGTITVETTNGNPWCNTLRALTDTGSQTNLITKEAVKRLQLSTQSTHVRLLGPQNIPVGTSDKSTIVEIKIPNSNRTLSFQFLIVDEISQLLPNQKIDLISNNPEFQTLKRADPNYDTPNPINALFGIGVWIKIIKNGLIKSKDETIAAQNTHFGWILYACKDDTNNTKQKRIYHTTLDSLSESQLNQILQRFWEVEDLPQAPTLTIPEQKCENIFRKGFSRNNDGRYVVYLPFTDKLNLLGKSKSIAIRQFLFMERKMQREPNFKINYINFIKEFEELNHLSKVENDKEEGYYTPHHGIISSSKFRVVFNASKPTTSGLSLNDCQLTGARLQKDLSLILMRFRFHEVALTADVVKMFRQIEVHDNHKKYQKIVWRNSPNESISVYQINRVVYGQAAAPFLAVRAMIQCAKDHADQYPLGARAVIEDFYVDDALTGADSIEEALELQNQLNKVLKEGCMELAKWCSNKSVFNQSNQKELEIREPESKSILGLRWLPNEDYFAYKIKQVPTENIWTKRKILSEIGKLYDPNGFISPLIISAKVLIQKIWQHKIDWDQPVPEIILVEWITFLNNLKDLENIKIPRWLGMKTISEIHLHGFSDASISAYSAVVYVLTILNDGQKVTHLLMSKTKVAPLKKLTIPRLELCGASMLANLITPIYPEFNNRISSCHLWLDSEVAYYWINKSPAQLKTFVANRVASIQHKTTERNFTWHWVPGEDNPADLASRGTVPSKLCNNNLWWNGPSWLTKPETFWPKSKPLPEKLNDDVLGEIKLVSHVRLYKPLTRGKWFKYKSTNQNEFPLLDTYSSLSKLKNVMAYILRVINKMKKITSSGPLTTGELELATTKLIKLDQAKTFHKEIYLQQTEEVPKNGKIMLDKEGILRLNGRVISENLTTNEQFPILLSSKGSLATLLIREAHKISLHGGVQQVLQLVRENFWITKARALAKKLINRCPTCFRFQLKTKQQLMAKLPTSRTTPEIAFTISGVDYLGPVGVSSKIGRRPIVTKAYVAVFVCFVTRAIHLELVSNASTDAFILAFRRFIGRRGQVLELHSDNGTNFVGANNFLKEVYANQKEEWANGEFASTFKLKWKFSVPNAPHHNGLQEAAVKSTKKHLQKVIGNQNLTFEEYATLLVQVEAVVNSRPLTPLNDDPDDLNALTPAHFLIGKPLITLAEPSNFTKESRPILLRWALLQQMFQIFWQRWHKEYIVTLSERTKWNSRETNVKINDLVIIKDDNLAPSHWNVGRIINIFPDSEGLVRSAEVKTKYGQYKRPITKLAVLPVNADTNRET